MSRKARTGSSFGARLVALRKARGITQVQLAEAIGSTQRAISYYENHADYPPSPVVADIAKALGVTTDELLEVKPSRKKLQSNADKPEAQWIRKKVEQLLLLPERDQRAVIRLINSLVAAKGK